MRIRHQSVDFHGGCVAVLQFVTPTPDHGASQSELYCVQRWRDGFRHLANPASASNLYIIVLNINTISGSCPRPE
jgi:hypothetical protein